MSTPDSLHVAVNLLWLASGRVGGSEQYLTRQLAGLPGCEDQTGNERGIDIDLFVQPRFVDAHPALVARFDTTVMPFRRDWRPVRIAAEHSWLPVRARRADLVHHGGGTVPFTGRHPVLLTIHDLQYLHLPHHFSATRRAYLERMMPRSATRATLIAVPSEYVRGTVIDAFGISPDRAVVVPHGVPRHVAPPDEVGSAVLDRLGVGDRRYVTYPAITHPHKRHTVLIDMLSHLPSDRLLVLIGGVGTAEGDLQAAIAASGMGDRVVRTGRVSDADRDALVAGAEAMVFPSEYEGFGAPLVEAMMLGTPVVCADHPAVVEVVGPAAVVVAEPTGEAWAAAVIEAERRAGELGALGAERSQQFTIERSGLALAAAYRQVAER